MSNHTIAPGFTINDVKFTSTFDPASASARLSEMDKPDPFKWRLLVGKFAAGAGQQAFKTTCTFTPNGAPAGTLYGIKQLAFHKFLSMYYKGLGDENGSQTLGTTSINFTWNLDCAGSFAGKNFAIPSLPFFSENPVAVRNGGAGSITVVDAPGGTARLVRANLLTGKRNYLLSYGSATDFITSLIVMPPDGAHIPVRAIAWSFSSESTVVWHDEKPTLKPIGRCAFANDVDPADLKDFRLAMLKNNAMSVQDTILFKVNQGLSTAEMQDAAATVTTGTPETEKKFNGGTYEIVHSKKLLQ